MKEDELTRLIAYAHELKRQIDNRIITETDRLIEIRNYIERCDYSAQSRMEKYFLFLCHTTWLRCLKKWQDNTPLDKNDIKIPILVLKTKKVPGQIRNVRSKEIQVQNRKLLPALKRTYEEMLTECDRRWLRTLFIDDENEWRH